MHVANLIIILKKLKFGEIVHVWFILFIFKIYVRTVAISYSITIIYFDSRKTTFVPAKLTALENFLNPKLMALIWDQISHKIIKKIYYNYNNNQFPASLERKSVKRNRRTSYGHPTLLPD